MKKITTFFSLILCLLMTSCGKTSPFYLDEEFYKQEGQIIELKNYDTIKENEDNKKSFIVYVYTPGCTSCAAFKPILEKSVNENKIVVYSISFSQVEAKRTKIRKKIKYTPSVLIYQKGKIVGYLDATNNDHNQYYESVDGLNNWFNQYIIIK